MRIILDCDGVLADTSTSVLNYYREKSGDYSTSLEDVDYWREGNICPLWTKERLDTISADPMFFFYMEPFIHAREYVEKWQNEGHEIIVCTIHKVGGMDGKEVWIRYHFPSIENIIILNNKNLDKSMIYGDVLVDDNLRNIQTSVVNYPICFGRPKSNISWTGRKVLNWEELDKQIQEIVELEGNINV